MNKCHKCGRYMSSHIQYIFGGSKVVWTCDCGYSNKNESYTIDNRTYIVKDNKFVTANRTKK